MVKRIFFIVLDGVGVGELPDADQYGDQGSNTLANIAKKMNGLNLPNLQKLGLGNIIPILGVARTDSPAASFGKMREVSPGKDSISGHWELMGLPLKRPFPTYPNGFPEEIIAKFIEMARIPGILGNKPASGTVIIDELGEEHLRTGKPIVYTSADSVFQIAAHMDVISLERLYDLCKVARTLLVNEHGVGRVIARPFIGVPGKFQRTAKRKDFPIKPHGPTIIENLQKYNIPTIAIGKVYDLFAGIGFDEKLEVASNAEGIEKLIEVSAQQENGFIACTLVDFDTLWGHRNDYINFARGLEDFDRGLVRLIEKLKPDDVVIITADHGCDPTTPSTDHSREYVPLLVYYKRIETGNDLGVRETFSDVAATIADLFEIPGTGHGKSFAEELTI
ncbi:MAG: phosphopentomutase [candidate division KSB1 bacterium]|nr:phosphopentomutase [candidate division KSB1 bacterium]MDZ7302520.1 phosphopentomutase [candidate division KSB1 bacterium]MDZ7311885.1 phosphopentomutase [candidate division KSB1 bacterium]